MHFEPGLCITDNIRLRQLVGAGGMGEIWAAEHVLLERPVAVKRLASQFLDSAEALERFAAEARAGARLESANVPRVFDYALLPDGTPFMVMELLDGVELYARIRDGKTLSLKETEHMVVQVCAALSSIHTLGIVHRDVKPENIFLVPSKDGLFTAKLLDFGIAKGVGAADSEELARVGATILGTPAYMSPEQIENAVDVDFRADLWSLTVVTYCCLTGTMPFEGETLTSLSAAIREGRFTPVTDLRPELPVGLDAWFRRGLGLDIDARFGTASEMARAFLAAAQPHATTVPAAPAVASAGAPPSASAPARRAPRRRAARTGLRVVTAVAAVAAAAAAMDPGFVLNWSTIPVGRALWGWIRSARELPASLRAHASDDAMDLPWSDESPPTAKGGGVAP